VAGGNGQGSSLSQLNKPCGMIVDQLGTVYVVDGNNHRIMRWPNKATYGSIVAGSNRKGMQANQFSYPHGLSFDKQNNLYIVENGNDRVQKFNIE
jgi:tripartite motif-containing protein 71